VSLIRAPFTPRPGQQAAIDAFIGGKKRLITIAHRRWGKDLRFFNVLWLTALRQKGLYNYYFPTFSLGKKIIWKGMDNEGRNFLDYIPAEVVADKNESDLRLELTNGSIIQIVGTANFNKNLIGINPIGTGFSEYPLCNPLAWELTRPILNANGGWAWFMYTPRGRNHGYHLYQNALANPDRWFVEKITVDDSFQHDGVTPIVTKAQIEQEIREGMDPDLAAQEFYCSFDSPLQGSYYGHLLTQAYKSGRVAPVAASPGIPTFVSWDIGVGDSTALWWAQLVGDDIRIIDYYEAHSQPFEHFFKIVMEKPYVYERMFFPHDIQQRRWGTGMSAEELVTKAFRARNIGVKVVDKLSIEDGIQAVRAAFPRFRFDEIACGQTKFLGHTAIDCLMNYHKKWDEDNLCFSNSPLHDWSSNAADSLRYLAIGLKHVKPGLVQTLYQTTFNPLYDIDGQYTETDENPLYDNRM
jgi:phage terminase large subunit